MDRGPTFRSLLIKRLSTVVILVLLTEMFVRGSYATCLRLRTMGFSIRLWILISRPKIRRTYPYLLGTSLRGDLVMLMCLWSPMWMLILQIVLMVDINITHYFLIRPFWIVVSLLKLTVNASDILRYLLKHETLWSRELEGWQRRQKLNNQIALEARISEMENFRVDTQRSNRTREKYKLTARKSVISSK